MSALRQLPSTGAHHTGGYVADPRGYERRVVGFFDRALLGSSAVRTVVASP